VIRAGDLRTPARIEQAVEADDGQGGVTRIWSVLDTVWCKASTTGGREFQTAKQTRPGLTHQLSLRYRSDLTAAMRVRFDSRFLAIAAVIDVDQRHEETQLFCEEIAGEDL
jgi:SPP1 family predicted phage head-tail adaptor